MILQRKKMIIQIIDTNRKTIEKKTNTAKKNKIQIINDNYENSINYLKTRRLLLISLMIWLKKSVIQIIDH